MASSKNKPIEIEEILSPLAQVPDGIEIFTTGSACDFLGAGETRIEFGNPPFLAVVISKDQPLPVTHVTASRVTLRQRFVRIKHYLNHVTQRGLNLTSKEI